MSLYFPENPVLPESPIPHVLNDTYDATYEYDRPVYGYWAQSGGVS